MSYVNTAVGQTEIDYQNCLAAQQDYDAWLAERAAYDAQVQARQACAAEVAQLTKELDAKKAQYQKDLQTYQKDLATWNAKSGAYQAAVLAAQNLQPKYQAAKAAAEKKYGVKLPTGVTCVTQSQHDKYYGKCHPVKGIGRLRGFGQYQAAMQAAVQQSQTSWMDQVPACMVADLAVCETIVIPASPGPKPVAPQPPRGNFPNCGTPPQLRTEPPMPGTCSPPSSGGGEEPPPVAIMQPPPQSGGGGGGGGGGGPMIPPSNDEYVGPAPYAPPEEQAPVQASFFAGHVGMMGLLAVVAVGAGGYYIWSKRKKKKAA